MGTWDMVHKLRGGGVSGGWRDVVASPRVSPPFPVRSRHTPAHPPFAMPKRPMTFDSEDRQRKERSDKGQKKGGADNKNAAGATVFPDPVDSDGFTFERATKVQCVMGQAYAVRPRSPESKYFLPLVAEAVTKAVNVKGAPAIHPLLSATFEALGMATRWEDVLEIRNMQYGQLKPFKSKQDLPDATDTYVAYLEDKKQLVRAPVSEGGGVYEVTSPKMWQWKAKLAINLDMGDLTVPRDDEDLEEMLRPYCLGLHLGKRTVEHVYCEGQGPHDVCISLTVGEVNCSTGNVIPWHTVMLQDESLMRELFWQTNNTGKHWPVWGEEDAGVDDLFGDGVEHAGGASHKWALQDVCGQMAYLPSDSQKKEWIAVCNFVLLRVEGVYMFVEDDASDPYTKVVCRILLSGDGPGVYLSSDEVNRCPGTDGASYIDVEVLLQENKLRTTADIKGAFKFYYAGLKPTTLTPDMLSCWLADNSHDVPVTRCIVRFGRQPNDVWVMANCAFREDRIVSVPFANFAVIHPFFGKNPILPLPKKDYPRIIIIPQCHIRYFIGLRLWKELIPAFFRNNRIPAMAVICGTIMHMYSSKIWKGQTGVGHGCPFIWAYSPEPNSGERHELIPCHDCCSDTKNCSNACLLPFLIREDKLANHESNSGAHECHDHTYVPTVRKKRGSACGECDTRPRLSLSVVGRLHQVHHVRPLPLTGGHVRRRGRLCRAGERQRLTGHDADRARSL